jgi:hypothetical protein
VHRSRDARGRIGLRQEWIRSPVKQLISPICGDMDRYLPEVLLFDVQSEAGCVFLSSRTPPLHCHAATIAGIQRLLLLPPAVHSPKSQHPPLIRKFETYPFVDIVAAKLHSAIRHNPHAIRAIAGHHTAPAFLPPHLAQRLANAHLVLFATDILHLQQNL